MKNYVTILFISFLALNANAQQKKTQTVIIQTSAECEECETRLEDKLNYTKGIKFAELEMNSMKLTVKFNSKKISLEQIKKEISKLGYSADELPADPEGLAKLPECCKPGGMGTLQHNK